jgi:pyridinium-3,5-bisthiocarboxylic acid mononucleotide nickel chelatase
MHQILYYDCFAGISGDMNLGALIDLGVDPAWLREELGKLAVGGYELRVSRQQRRGISGTKADVLLSAAEASPEPHRTFQDITRLIDQSTLSDGVKKRSLEIFSKIAAAEAKVHGCAPEQVHFHEVGAVDSLVDIVGAALCLEFLKIGRIFSGPVQLGEGMVECAHGILPVPAPATAEILKGIPVKTGLVPFEAATPTGAAILAATVESFGGELAFIPRRIGYGIGSRDSRVPNVLRVFLGDLDASAHDHDLEIDQACLVECNIDDMNPELYEGVMEALFSAGAQDVFFTPIIMKKSRPAVKIGVICGVDIRKQIEALLLLQTSTLGVRTQQIVKSMLRREEAQVETSLGKVTVKYGCCGGKRIKGKLEFEECKRLAKEKGVSVKEIYDRLKREGL